MYHKIHPLKVYNLAVYSIVTELYNHHFHLIPEHFHHPQRSPYPLTITPIPPFPQVTTNLPSVSMDLPFLNISYKWNHKTWPFMSPFTQHNIFEVRPCCSMNQCFTPFHG